MNYIELYKACKDYAEFVEANFEKVEAVTNVLDDQNIESYQDISADEVLTFMSAGDIIPMLLRKQDAIVSPIQKEIAELILRSIDERREMTNTIKETLENNCMHHLFTDVCTSEEEPAEEPINENWIDDIFDDTGAKSQDFQVKISTKKTDEEDLLEDLFKDFFGDRNV